MIRLPKPFYAWTTYAGHAGIDYPRATGTPIMADRPGRITFSGWYNNRSGYMKEIDHGGGVRQRYYHLVNLNGPKLGEWVPEYNHIGYVGNTGTMSTGPHLHHEVWINGSLKAPNLYWNYVDRFKVVTVPPPPPPPPPAPEPEPEEEEETMFTVHLRVNSANQIQEATLGHQDFGKGLATFIRTATGGEGGKRVDSDGRVTTFKGFKVTSDPKIYTAWARTYAKGLGNVTSRTQRDDNIDIQAELSRVATELS